MKKFITFITQQDPLRLNKLHYEVDNPLLEYELTAFPIIPVINAYLEKDDDFCILAITSKNKNAERNCETFEQEVHELCQKKGISYDKEKHFESISIPFDDSLGPQLNTFQQLISRIEDEDQLYACVTFGSKPSEIVELMTLRYARQIKKNVYIEYIVYGQVLEFEAGRAKRGKLHTLTALIHLDDIIRALADAGDVFDPEKVIETILA